LSLDGASRKTFSKYRIGGDFDLVVSNVRKLQAIKKMLNSKSPKVIYKFMVNKYNEAEIDYAKRLANNLGIDFLAAPMYLADKSPDLNLEKNIEERKKDWLPVNKRYISTSYGGDYGEFITKNKCYQLFISIFINPDGTVFPCCWLTDKKNTFGNILHDSLEDIWNGKKYSISRRLFFSKRAFGQTTETICSKCKNFKKRNYEFS
jgi:radical SAM protein with 4Fe4S-binding SPASM domain